MAANANAVVAKRKCSRDKIISLRAGWPLSTLRHNRSPGSILHAGTLPVQRRTKASNKIAQGLRVRGPWFDKLTMRQQCLCPQRVDGDCGIELAGLLVGKTARQ